MLANDSWFRKNFGKGRQGGRSQSKPVNGDGVGVLNYLISP